MMSSIWILACPLVMFAMGGVAWGLSRIPGRRAQRLARVTSHASCMPIGNVRQQPAEAGERTPSASTEGEIASRV